MKLTKKYMNNTIMAIYIWVLSFLTCVLRLPLLQVQTLTVFSAFLLCRLNFFLSSRQCMGQRNPSPVFGHHRWSKQHFHLHSQTDFSSIQPHLLTILHDKICWRTEQDKQCNNPMSLKYSTTWVLIFNFNLINYPNDMGDIQIVWIIKFSYENGKSAINLLYLFSQKFGDTKSLLMGVR